MTDIDGPHEPRITPHLWARRVLLHLNGRGQASEYPLAIEHLKEATEALTDVNRIRLRPVSGPEPHWILGRFTRIHRVVEGALYPIIEVVIDFEKTVSEKDRRLVITKELCHAFYSDLVETRSVTQSEMLALMEGLAAFNNGTALRPQSPALEVERQAMYTAVEILMPFEVRAEIIERYRRRWDKIPIAELSDRFLVPVETVAAVFTASYHHNAEITWGQRARGRG